MRQSHKRLANPARKKKRRKTSLVLAVWLALASATVSHGPSAASSPLPSLFESSLSGVRMCMDVCRFGLPLQGQDNPAPLGIQLVQQDFGHSPAARAARCMGEVYRMFSNLWPARS